MDSNSCPPWIWPRASYVHVPFCAFHCGYCDFAVAVGQDERIDTYIDALDAEMAQLGQPQPVQTLFLGGGTPTHLSAAQLERLLNKVLAWLPLTVGHEFSVEANPATLTADKIAVLADHGVNRLSLGAQSFTPHLLKTLERDHEPPDVPRAVERIRQHIDNISLDLIFGVPGQTLRDWQDDMQQALTLKPNHIATYGLTYEKGTRLWKQQRAGQVQALDEQAELDMYTHAMDALAAAGFEHYEISNFARPGYRCRHNRVYWANHAYFGFGMGAARYVEGVRQTNVRELVTYLKRMQAQEPTYFQSEELSPLERALETAVLNLRRTEGILSAEFRVQTGFDMEALFPATLQQLEEQGMLLRSEAGIRLSRQGRCVADAVVAKLLSGRALRERSEATK